MFVTLTCDARSPPLIPMVMWRRGVGDVAVMHLVQELQT